MQGGPRSSQLPIRSIGCSAYDHIGRNQSHAAHVSVYHLRLLTIFEPLKVLLFRKEWPGVFSIVLCPLMPTCGTSRPQYISDQTSLTQTLHNLTHVGIIIFIAIVGRFSPSSLPCVFSHSACTCLGHHLLLRRSSRRIRRLCPLISISRILTQLRNISSDSVEGSKGKRWTHR